MELEVRLVGDIESCFVSLPLSLIQTLESTTVSGHLPPVLALQLRSNNHLWHVAWSGSASSSSSIQVAKKFAECINLPDNVKVQVRAVSNLPKATLVTIEPHSEDDWEILELNAEHAEAAILKQIGIVHEGMAFPLWLHGRTIITFLVVSTFPEKPVVQLVPGTEVAVAPKRRKRSVDPTSNKEHSIVKALLRVQDVDKRLVYKSEVRGVELGVVLTSVVFIHPETAKNHSFDADQLVAIVPKLPPKDDNLKNQENDALRKKNSPTVQEVDHGNLTTKKDYHHAIVSLLFSDTVAKGHIMLSQSMQLYFGAGLHSWVYVKSCNVNVKRDIPPLSVSPCRFKISIRKKGIENNDRGALDSQKTHMTKSSFLKTNSDVGTHVVDWSIHEEVVATLTSEYPTNDNEDVASELRSKKGMQGLLRAWFLGQLDAIALNTRKSLSSLVLGNQTLLHFEVKGNKFGRHGIRKRSEESVDIFFILTILEESLHIGEMNAYKLSLDEENKNSNSGDQYFLCGKLDLGEPVSFYSIKERNNEKVHPSTISSLSWMGKAVSDITNRLTILLSWTSRIWFTTHDLPFPGHVLIYGPSGSGKTSLATAVAKSLEEDGEILAHIVFISCSGLASEKASSIRQAFSSYISEAIDHAPSIVIFDDLDSIISSSSDSEGSQPFISGIALTEFLTDIIDECGEGIKASCGIGPIAFIASVGSLENLPQSLSSSGRLDFHVQLPAPAASERGAILKHEIQKRSLECSDDVLLDVASKCDGYDAYDLETLVDRTVHAAIGRHLPYHSSGEERENPSLLKEDFSVAMHEFLPVAMRDITKSAPEGGRSGWEDVGALLDIQSGIQEMIELPSKFPDIFAKAPLRLRSNVLLYGPPGCGKTHIVGAAAAACSLRFISIKGPELLNKYIGASEQAVRDIFSKAAAASPCLLFFDEFDSIAPKRGHDNTGVTDRVVNQFLTELDGVEVLTGVFVFAATSRPDLLDAALLRPGRLDRLLYCGFPSPSERVDILRVLSRKLPMAGDVDLNEIGYMSEGFSGADLQALLSDAQLAAVHELLENVDYEEPRKMPVITHALLKSVAAKTRPSVSEAEKHRLHGIYSQFLDSKKSASQQTRDAKGKRATLA